MKIAVLGLGNWGFCLARQFARNGHSVIGWTIEEGVLDLLRRGEDHPTLHRSSRGLPIEYAQTLEESVQEADFILEAVTTKGLRSVLEKIKKTGSDKPIILTSKGIEQKTFMPTPFVVLDVMGKEFEPRVCLLSGPSFAAEVVNQLPTAIVCGSWNLRLSETIIRAVGSKSFRLYANSDICGVALGGALKNIIAIACGIADGLELGFGSRASLVTRGLHEIVRLAVAQECKRETLYGLSGLGDLYLTCSSPISRNFKFGRLLSTGLSLQEAEGQIGMVVEGAYTCRAAKEMAEKFGISMPITEAVYDILSGTLPIKECVERLMLRSIKGEEE